MYIHFKYENGGNPHIATTAQELFRMINKYVLEQDAERAFTVKGEAVVYSVRRGKISARDKKQIALCEFAKQWQFDFDRFSYSWADLCGYAAFFEEYGRKYGLLREFRENGIC